MKNKGFTLVELLAVIIILSVLVLVVTFVVEPTIRNSKNSLSDIQISQIEGAAKIYFLEEGINYINYNKDTTNSCVSISYLIDNGYFDADEILNPTDNSEITGSVKISYSSNQYRYEYMEDSCYMNEYMSNLYSQTKTVTINSIVYSLDVTNGLMYDRLGGTTDSLTGGNLRYYGANPNNYIDIGDRDAAGNVILYRIIGLFKDVTLSDNTTADLIKVVRDGTIGSYSWDFKSDGSYSTDWNNSTLNTLLNNVYYNSTTSTYYNSSTTATSVDFTSIGLSNEARNKIENVVWNIGGITDTNVYSDDIYEIEKQVTWPGKIALIGISDYAYALDYESCTGTLQSALGTCNANLWLTKSASFFINFYDSSDEVWAYGNSVILNISASISEDIRPSFYLKSNIEYVTGTGTVDDPIVVR